MKTIKEYLEQLNEPYRTQALDNTENETLEQEALNLAYALLDAFIWDETPEGTNYWESLHSLIETNQEN